MEVAKRFPGTRIPAGRDARNGGGIEAAGLPCKTVFKVNEGRPNAVDLLKAGTLKLVIYTTTAAIRSATRRPFGATAVTYRIPCITTMSGARAAAEAIVSRHRDPIRVWSLQEMHSELREAASTQAI